MKILITKIAEDSSYTDEDAVGKVHLLGPIDTTACGLAEEMYHYKSTTKPVTCTTCQDYLSWAKEVAKIKK